MKNSKNPVSKALIVAAVVVALSALSLTVVNAMGDDQQTVFEKVAEKLQVDSEDLKSAFKDVKIDSINQAVQDGKMDEDRATEIIEKIESGDMEMFRGNKGHRGGRQERILRLHNDIAEYLGLSKDEMKEQFTSGKTILEVATEQGKSEAELRGYLKEVIEGNLQTALDEEKIDQERYDKMIEDIDEIVEKFITKTPGEKKGRKDLTQESE